MAGEVVVLDASGQRCAAGAVGEIAVRSPFNFDGYIDDDRLSAATLVDGWYRTGDVGRVDADGYVFLQGRGSELINRGGEKIAPSGIDRALEAIPGIAEAAAFAVPHRTLGQELVAAVVRRDGANIDPQAMLDQLRVTLPLHHLPRAISFVAALPRTDSGKVRRAALAEAYGSGALQREASDTALEEAPATPIEIALAPLWAAVLRTHAVPRNANFFLLGGDSLSGMQLLVSVGQAFAVELPMDVLFGSTATLAGMAKAIARARGDGS
jgi:acyl carrier protein